MYLLDTDTLTYLYAGHPQVVSRLQQAGTPNVATTIITKIEVLRGRMDAIVKAADGGKLLHAQQRFIHSEQFLEEMIVVPVDQLAATLFDRLTKASALQKVGHADLLIASITLANRATLVTRNRRHFAKVPGLALVNWVD
ncbi:MAG: PIN domain-containing protein [Caldilineaceae bacterium]